MKEYYKAYDDRYRAIHEKGLSWSSDEPTPIVSDVIGRFGIEKTSTVLEIGCGEGRDAIPLLREGYSLLATDVSPEAVEYCRKESPDHSRSFQCLDCLKDSLDRIFDMIYSIAVIHMLVPDGDRRRFYAFIHDHLSDGGIGLICSMGDGTFEMQTDIRSAFDVRKRDHPSGEVMVSATSCRMVSFETFENEISERGLVIVEKGITSSLPDFDKLIYAVVRKA